MHFGFVLVCGTSYMLESQANSRLSGRFTISTGFRITSKIGRSFYIMLTNLFFITKDLTL